MSTNGRSWLAAHLYREEPWEDFLIQAVGPFAEEAVSRRWVSRFFFVRYWETGPHIRLRLAGEAKKLQETVAPALSRHFQTWMNQNPSPPAAPDRAVHQTVVGRSYACNSIQYVDYEPETERYGGPEGIVIAEDHFQASSRAVLEILRSAKAWNYERALGSAIPLHLGFLYAVGLDLVDCALFFGNLFRAGLGWFDGGEFGRPVAPDSERIRQCIGVCQELFEKQREMLIPIHERIWTALQQRQEFEQDWLNDWISGGMSTGSALRSGLEAGRIASPTGVDQKNMASDRALWPIYISYLHMTNNRLGVHNWDEVYLAYLMKEVLRGLIPQQRGVA